MTVGSHQFSEMTSLCWTHRPVIGKAVAEHTDPVSGRHAVSVGTGKTGAGPEPGMQHQSGHGGNRKWKLALAGLVGAYLALSVYGLATAYPDHTGPAGKGSPSGA